MPVWLKRVAWTAAVLVGLAVAAGAWLILTFDPNRYKGALVEWVQTHNERTLEIEGPISLAVFPRLAVTLRDVRLSEHRSEEEFASVREAALAVQLWPLLRRELLVDRIDISGASLRYRRDADGHRNIDDLLAEAAAEAGGQAPAPAPTPEGEPGEGLRFGIESISLRNVEAQILDVPAGIEGRIAIVELSTGRLAEGVESPVKLLARATLTKPAVNAGMDLRTQLTLALPRGQNAHVQLRDLSVALDGEALGYRGARATLTGQVELDGPRGAIRAEGVQLTASVGREGLTLENGTVSLERLAFEPETRSLTLQALGARLTGRDANRRLVASLDWPSLTVEGDQIMGSPLRGDLAVSGAEQVTLRFTSGAPAGRFEGIRVPDLTIVMEGAQGERRINGGLTAALALVPQPVSLALSSLNANLTLTEPGLPPWAMRAQGELSVDARLARWDLLGTLNEQAYFSDGRVAFSGARPNVEARARFNRLDLTRFVTSPAGSPPPARGGHEGSDAPIDLSGLESIDGRFDLRADELIYPPVQARAAQVVAALDGGVLRVTRFGAQVWNGSVTGSASADAGRRMLGLKATAERIDVGRMWQDLAQRRDLEGTGRVSLDVRAQGDSVQSLTAALGGQAAIELRDGAVRGINLAQSLRRAKAALGGGDETQPADQTLQTDFSEIRASWRITDGVAHSRDLDARSPFLRVGGEGSFDLNRRQVDYLARVTITSTPEGQGGAELAALKGLTVPVQLSGPFDAVSYRIRWSAVARSAIEREVRTRLEERLQRELGSSPAPQGENAPDNAQPKSVEERLRDRLRGLLR